MKTRVLLFAAIAATTFTFVACGNKQAKINETAAVEQSGAMEIDSLLACSPMQKHWLTKPLP